jgi:hypothetical protein
MKKLEIERMQRLEEMELRQREEIRQLKDRLEQSIQANIKLIGANEALTELIVRLKKGD